MTGFNLLERELVDEREKSIFSLVEYIKTQSLSFFDEALAIRNLIENYGLTQEEAAEKLGRVQSTIANKLRLLRLTFEEQRIIIQYNLTERHARALLRIASPIDRKNMLDNIISEGLNVEKTEQMINDFIGNENHRQSGKNRLLHNVTAFINTMNKSVEAMKVAGIATDSYEVHGDDYIEYRIKINIDKQMNF